MNFPRELFKLGKVSDTFWCAFLHLLLDLTLNTLKVQRTNSATKEASILKIKKNIENKRDV